MSNEEIEVLADHLWHKWALKLEDENGFTYLTKGLFTLAIQDILPKEPPQLIETHTQAEINSWDVGVN